MIGLGMLLGLNGLNTLGKKLSNTLLVYCGLSGILAQHMGVRGVFAVCAIMLVILIAVGKLWMEPKPAPKPTA